MVVAGEGFEHVVYWHAGRKPSSILNIYLDGDGRPWRVGKPSDDPTPRNPLVLDLMSLDPNPAAYLGRPCYHSLAEAPGCGPALWTSARYGLPVVESMATAARRLLEHEGYAGVRWFGYSGGGALAMLLAPRVEGTVLVVTVAANLDVERWARLHAYTPLSGSLNPATAPPLPPHVRQRHYAGARDDVVPPAVVTAAPVPRESVVIVPRYDHVCCWKDMWPAILSDATDPR